MASVGRLDARGGVGERVRRALGEALEYPEPLVAAGLTVAFVAISMWWVSVDARIPNGDNGKHIVHAFTYMDEFRVGHWLAPLFDYTQYPPLVHVVGAFAALIAGPTIANVIVAENLVFVPLLALGLYKTGSLVFGRLAGLLAVVFAFASPMVMSLFHVFMLDAPAAALAAVSVWLLLASRQFSSLPYSLAAAVAIAAGMYVKTTFVFFVAGLVAALLVRGGWRNWRTAAVAGAVFLVLVEPWYFIHFQDIRGLTSGAIEAQPQYWHGTVPYPDRWSLQNFTWYGWSLVNNQLYVPLAAFFAVGLGIAVVDWVRRRSPQSYVPELLIGLVVSYVGVSLISLDDSRYIVPMLVYVAVFATGWVVRLRPKLQIAAVAVLALVLVLNTTLVNLVGGQHELRLTLPGAPNSPIGEREFMFASNGGYIEGRPDPNGLAPRFIDLLERAHADGAEQVVFQPESMNSGGYNLFGLAILARSAGLHVPGFDWSALAPEDVYVFRVHPSEAKRPPCFESWDKTGIYMVKGQPSATNPIYCPPPEA